MNELQQYYEESFAPNNLPEGFRPLFEELSDTQKESLKNSLVFAGWRIKKAQNELGLAFRKRMGWN